MWITLAFILGCVMVCVGSGLLWGVTNIIEHTRISDCMMEVRRAENKLWRDVGNATRIRNLKQPRIS